ncbi:MAG: Trp family transcriptional regulator [Patescibacteria group bacterium]
MEHKPIDNFKRDIVHNLAEIQTDKNMRRFLDVLLTPSEFDELSRRLQILKRLVKGKTQREIAKDLGVGIATVERGASELREKQKVKKMISK